MRKTLILAMSALLISPAALLCCAAAMAETQAPATTAAPNPEPVTFGDWTLRCGTSPDGATRACEVDSWIVEEGQKQPVAQIAFGRAVTTPGKTRLGQGERQARQGRRRQRGGGQGQAGGG